MKYWLDEEFAEDGERIDLISIGIVAEDGREYYRQTCCFNPDKANQWVMDNVIPHLTMCDWLSPVDCASSIFQHHYGKCPRQNSGCPWRHRGQIADEIAAFMDPEKYGKPELIGWYCSYDHVALCQLFGPMVNIPTGWPYHIHDIQCVLEDRKISDDQLPQQEGQSHNALEDARHIKLLWEFLYSKETAS